MGHAMVMTTRSGKGGDATTSNQRRIMDDDVEVQEDEIPSNMVHANDEVRIDIDENVEEMQEEIRVLSQSLVLLGAPTFPKLYVFMLKTLGIGQPRPISMRLQMADRTMKRPLGIIDDMLVRVDKFILPVDFVILDYEVDYEVPIILGRPFLATGKALVYVQAGELTFRVGDKKMVFHVCKSMRQPNSNEVCSYMDLVTEVIIDDASAMMNAEDTLEAVLPNHDDDEKKDFVECRFYFGGALKE
ncbi:uncharacterized protein [Nicotiana tomentosiformis]|uniref:uncharacterized protein n=1 Tax=Nicotiana tomentosiformis TaxID=4098 RepID=UPI00388CAB14